MLFSVRLPLEPACHIVTSAKPCRRHRLRRSAGSPACAAQEIDRRRFRRAALAQLRAQLGNETLIHCHPGITLPLHQKRRFPQGPQIRHADERPFGLRPDVHQQGVPAALKRFPTYVGSDIASIGHRNRTIPLIVQTTTLTSGNTPRHYRTSIWEGNCASGFGLITPGIKTRRWTSILYLKASHVRTLNPQFRFVSNHIERTLSLQRPIRVLSRNFCKRLRTINKFPRG
jgi:hypothetical protein